MGEKKFQDLKKKTLSRMSNIAADINVLQTTVVQKKRSVYDKLQEFSGCVLVSSIRKPSYLPPRWSAERIYLRTIASVIGAASFDIGNLETLFNKIVEEGILEKISISLLLKRPKIYSRAPRTRVPILIRLHRLMTRQC